MNKSKISYYCATLGPIGYMGAPGTIASGITYLGMYVINAQDVMNSFVGVGICTLALIGAYIITKSALRYLDRSDDPKEIVIDELIGSLCALLFVPATPLAFVCSFILFRFFDILKPWPINKAELLFGAWGVLIDDVVAGLFSAGITYVIWHVIIGS